MLIYDALKNDHDTLKLLLKRLVESFHLDADGDSEADNDARSELLKSISDELVPHARAEEAVFYNSLRTIDAAKDIIVHGYEEHAEAETLLRTLQAMDQFGVEFEDVAKQLKDVVEHHIAEEESTIFEAAKQILVDEEARMMAQAFAQMKPEIREGGFLQNTIDLVANAMPSRFSQPLRSFLYRP